MGAQHLNVVCGVCGVFDKFVHRFDKVVPLGALEHLMLPAVPVPEFVEWRHLVPAFPSGGLSSGPPRYFGLAPRGVVTDAEISAWDVDVSAPLEPAVGQTWHDTSGNVLSCVVCHKCHTALSRWRVDYDKNPAPTPAPPLPLCTLRRADWGRVPADMPKLNLAEVMLLSEVLNFSLLLKVNGLDGPTSQLALKGHFIAFPHDALYRADSFCRALPRNDLPHFFKLTLLGPLQIMGLFQSTIKARLGFLQGRASVVIQWLTALRLVRAHLGIPWPAGGDGSVVLDAVALQASFDQQFAQILEEAECLTDPICIAIDARAGADIAGSVHDPHCDQGVADGLPGVAGVVGAGVDGVCDGAGEAALQSAPPDVGSLPWVQLSVMGGQLPEGDPTVTVLRLLQGALATATGLVGGTPGLPDDDYSGYENAEERDLESKDHESEAGGEGDDEVESDSSVAVPFRVDSDACMTQSSLPWTTLLLLPALAPQQR